MPKLCIPNTTKIIVIAYALSDFQDINKKINEFFTNNDPVISVDAKKKEHIGNRFNKGKEWRLKGNPRKVDDHDFPDLEKGIAIPYGVYDVKKKSRLGKCWNRSRNICFLLWRTGRVLCCKNLRKQGASACWKKKHPVIGYPKEASTY